MIAISKPTLVQPVVHLGTPKYFSAELRWTKLQKYYHIRRLIMAKSSTNDWRKFVIIFPFTLSNKTHTGP